MRGVLEKKCCSKFRRIHRKTPVPESLFNKVAGFRQLYQKRDSGTGVFL